MERCLRIPTRPTFSIWLKAQHNRIDQYVGDLARDALRDGAWPRGSDLSVFLRHLLSEGACSEAITGLEVAYKEWASVYGEPKQEGRQPISLTLRFDVFKRDGYRCCICGRSAQDGVKLEVDHIVPVALGGQTVEGNLQTLCFDCNRGKRDRLM